MCYARSVEGAIDQQRGPSTRRRHRILTVPSGIIAFACLFLPGYRDCGKNIAMLDRPATASACIVGLVVAVLVLVFTRHRAELGVAIGCLVVTIFAAGLMVFGVVATTTFVGVNLAAAALLGLAAGSVCWLIEVRGNQTHVVLTVLVPLAATLYVTVAALSTWHPPPEDHQDLGPLLVH